MRSVRRFAPFLVALALTTGALAQSSGVAGSTATTTTGNATTTTTVKQALKSARTQLVIDAMHLFFQAIRPVLGLPAAATDPSTDPLAMLEASLATALTASAGQ